MKVISQDKHMIVDFTCGIWKLCDNNIIMESLDGSYVWLFASFDTIDIASSVFEDFMSSAMNDNIVTFDFSKVNSNGEFIDTIPNNQLLYKQQLLDLINNKDRFINYVKNTGVRKNDTYNSIYVKNDKFNREVIWNIIGSESVQYSIYPFEDSIKRVTYVSYDDAYYYVDEHDDDCCKEEFFSNIK